jgi:hypothetical protein
MEEAIMVKIKSGVQPVNLIILAAIANVSASLPYDVYITSGNDGTHMKTSKHYSYAALDVRTKNFPDAVSKRNFMAAVLKRLGKGYQGILESEGTENEHLHFEYDPS